MLRMNLSTFDVMKHIESDECMVLSEEQLRALQKVLLAILDDVLSVCEEHAICCTLGGGSALGAVRHQGIIPWDDDIDLNMPRADYEKFMICFEEKYGDKYWIRCPEKTKNYSLLSTQIRLKGTSFKTRDDFSNEECGVFLDIFVIENTFDSALLRKVHGVISLVLGFLLSCRKFYRDREHLMRLAGSNEEIKKVFQTKIRIGRLVSFCSVDFLTRTADRWHSICKNNNSRYVAIPSGRKHFFGELYSRADVCDTVEMPYEGRMVKCPAAYDRYLCGLYGDYMKIPAPENRETHIVFKPFDLGTEVKD